MAHHESSEERNGMSVNERDDLEAILTALREATMSFERDPLSEEQQCSVCLLTRSAYTEFFSLSEFCGEIDERSSTKLRQLFGRILALLPRDGGYYESVANRSQEFEAYCRDLPQRDKYDTAVSM